MKEPEWFVRFIPRQWRWKVFRLIMDYCNARIKAAKIDNDVPNSESIKTPEHREACILYGRVLDTLGLG